MAKKILALTLSVMMLAGIFDIVPVLAEWAPSAGDGYTNTLATINLENRSGISGVQAMSDSGFESGEFNTTDWKSVDSTLHSIVDASAEGLANAAEHGKVFKALGEPIATSAETKKEARTAVQSPVATKGVFQTDLYVENIGDKNNIQINATVGSASRQIIRITEGGIVEVINGGTWTEVVTIDMNKWYTLTVKINDAAATFDLWMNDTCVQQNIPAQTNMASDGNFKDFRLAISKAKNAETTPVVYWDNLKIYYGDASIVGNSPLYSEPEIIESNATSYETVEGNGTVLKINGTLSQKNDGTYWTQHGVTNPVLVDPTYDKNVPSDKKIAEFSQVKVEADIYIPDETPDNATVKLGVLYVNDSGEEKRELITDISDYDAGWHNVVMYVDSVNHKVTSYVDGELNDDEEHISSSIRAPRQISISTAGTYVYADNIKFSIPEYYDEFGGGITISGEQKMTNPEIIASSFDTLAIDSEWRKADGGSIITASDALLADAQSHGYVIKQEGAVSDTAEQYTMDSFVVDKSKKVIMQADVYIEEMPDDKIDVFSMTGRNSENDTVSSGETVRILPDGTVNAYVTVDEEETTVAIAKVDTKKWYTFTIAIDISTSEKTINVWINGKQVLTNATPKLSRFEQYTTFRTFELELGCKKNNKTAPVVYWDNVNVYVGTGAKVSGIKAPKFTTTRHGENKYNLAYILEGSFAEDAVLIAAVYSEEGKTLDSVNLAESRGGLSDEDCDALVVNYELTSEQTIAKMLWKDLSTLVPLMPKE